MTSETSCTPPCDSASLLSWDDGILTVFPTPYTGASLEATGLSCPIGTVDLFLEDGCLSLCLTVARPRLCDSIRVRIGDEDPFLISLRGADEHFFSFDYPQE